MADLLHILIVEDNPGDVLLLREALKQAEEARFQADHVPSMAQALLAIAAHRFDAILLDLSLLDSVGLPTLWSILPSCGWTPVVVLTGQADEQVARQAMQHGAQDYLVKGAADGRSIVRAILYAVARRKSQEDREQLRVQAEVLAASENEQRRLGRDLHDSIQSNLVGLGMMIEALQRRVAKVLPDLAGEFDVLMNITKDTLTHTRGLSRSLCPIDLNEGGLQRALVQLAETTNGLFRVPCQVERVDAVKLADEAAATHLYYIAREAVTNAVRHAHAKRITIRLQSGPQELSLIVQDDGRGMPEGRRDNHGLGLKTMAYRAKVIGGLLSVDSAQGKGTSIRLTISQPHQQ